MSEWRNADIEKPEIPEKRISVEVICATADGNVVAMDWSHKSYAKTEKGQEPRWLWHGMRSPWVVTHWMPMPLRPEEQGDKP